MSDDGIIDETVSVQAVVGGRRITLDPVMERDPVFFPVVRVENSLAAGFRMEWISGTTGPDNEIEFDLTAGAGVASPYLVLTITDPDLGSIEEVVDMREAVRSWLMSALAAGATPKPNEKKEASDG